MPRLITFLLTLIMITAPISGAMAKDAVKAVNIGALEAARMLGQDAKATFLIDVRTRRQYTLLGHAPQAYNIPWRFGTDNFQVKNGDLKDGGKALYTGYQLEPEPNPDFIGVVKSLFKPDDKLLIISQEGDLSAPAADALISAGFSKVYNLRHGFMGEPLKGKDQEKLAEKLSPYFGLGGKVNGWVFWGLPVTFNINPKYIYPPDIKRMQSSK